MTDADTTRAILDALEPYRNKREGKNRYNTPWRDGADGGTLAVDEDAGYGLGLKWYDHKDDTHGNGVDLARRLGVALPARGVVLTPRHKAGYADLSDYARAHHAPVAAFESAGWHEVRRGGQRNLLAFAFPTDTGARYRYADEEKAGRKFDHDRGTVACWYGLERAVGLAGAGPLVLCNGEPSVIAAQHYGVPACAVTNGEKGSMSDALLVELRQAWTGPVLVAFDSDTTGRKAAPVLASQLRALGYDARAVDLGGAEGYDLADFCGDRADDARAALDRLPTLTVAATAKAAQATYSKAPTHPIDVNDLLAMPHKPVRWFAPSFVRVGLGILAGLPQVGKTPLAIQLAIAIANGEKWMNHIQCERARVLFLGPEYSRSELSPMVDMSRMGKAIERGWLAIKTMEDEFPTDEAGALSELEYYITALGYEMIIIDTFTAFLPPAKMKQNIYRGDYEELKPYHRLANLHDVGVMGTWHANKRELDPAKMYNGSVGLWAAAASRMTIYTDQENRVRLSSFPRMEERVDVALAQERTLTGRRWIVADDSPEPVLTSEKERQIYAWLRANSDKENPRSASVIAEMTRIPGPECRTYLGRMHEKNVIQKIGAQRDASYFVTPSHRVAAVAAVAGATAAAAVMENNGSEPQQPVAELLRSDSAPGRAETPPQQPQQHFSAFSATGNENATESPAAQADDLVSRLRARRPREDDHAAD